MADELDDRGLVRGRSFDAHWEMTPREARAMLDDAACGFVLLDVRQDDEVRAACVRGALHIPLHELALRIGEVGDDDETPIGALCHHGRRSLQAAVLLREYGFVNARSVAGGIDLWSVAVDASVPRYTRIAGECRPIA